MVLAQLEMGIPLFATISWPPGCSVPAEQCASRQGTTHCQVELLGIGGRGGITSAASSSDGCAEDVFNCAPTLNWQSLKSNQHSS